METIHEFLDELARRGVKLSARADQLSCYAQKGALTSELRDGIVRFKPEILALLARNDETTLREFPLSAGQKGLYILQKLHPQTSAYNVPLCFRINADIDARLLARAWQRVLERFPILTARIIERHGGLYQRLDARCRTALHQRNLDEGEELLSFLRTRVKQPFDLNRGPLTRIELITQSRQKPILLLTVHHIVFDGASAVIVLKSLLDFYQGAVQDTSSQKCGYEDFVAWEEKLLSSSEGAAHARYWQQQLDGQSPAVELSPDFSRPELPSLDGRTRVDDLPEDLCRWVRELSTRHLMPPSVIFLAMFQLLVHRYTGQDEVVVGMPVMGRSAQPFAMEVGYFINMVPLRTHCGVATPLISFLRKVQGTMLDALYHSSYPFPLIVEAVASGRREKGPIFKISYAYQNFVKPSDFMSLLQQQMFELETVPGVWQEGDFDLGLEIYEGEASAYSVHIKYNPDLYAHETIRAFFERYCVLLRAASADVNALVHELPLLTARETEALLAFNDTRADLPQQCVHDLFVEQVELHADRIAVEHLTYRQLHEKTQDVAVHLQSLGVGPDRVIAIDVARPLDRVIAVLGVLQAGGAYLLLDPADPAERRAQILRDCGATLVLQTLDGIPERQAVLQRHVGADHLASVGVAHRALVNRICSLRKKPGITEHDTVVTSDILLPLCSGARLAIDMTPEATIVHATPWKFLELVDGGWTGGPNLTMWCDGEPLSRALANRLLATGGAVWSLYASTVGRVEPGDGPVQLGAPTDNTTISILDRHGVPQIPGLSGELHIGSCRSGDLARWRDGGIELLGRCDTQVDFRGIRIELREIETRLTEHSAVEECAMTVVGQRLIACYRAEVAIAPEELRAHLSHTLPAAMVPAAFFRVTAIPDRAALPEMILQVQREYWRQTLSDVSALDFMPDHPGTDRFVAGRHPFALDPEVTAQLQHLVERRGANLSVALLGAFTVLLHRYTGQRDLCVGAGAMPLRTHVEPDDTFSALLTQVKASWLEAQQHQDVPVEAAPFGLTAMSIDYNAALYEPETIQRMAEHFVALCRAVAAKPAAKIRTLNFLSDAEKQRVIVDFNDTYADSPNNRCVHHLLGDQIALHPESTALALHLQSIGVTPDSLVAICVERSVDPVTAILGTLQAGGAYLLLDPADADDQLAYVLQDSAAPVVLTQEKLRYRLAPLVASNAKLVPLDQRVPATHGTLREDVKPSHACCVSYAAGDAGKPKGVVVEHKAMVNRVSWLQRRYALDVMSALTAVTLPSLYRPADNAIEVADDRPADNSRIYILDPHGHPQPIGVAGEICVAGESLAREFLHRPKQTQESFVANPFVPGTRMLRTGDRGRWRNDGTLQYLGGKQ